MTAPPAPRNGQIMTGLTVIEYLLADEGPGDGGVCIVPGPRRRRLRQRAAALLRPGR
jgi:hypothetical protein